MDLSMGLNVKNWGVVLILTRSKMKIGVQRYFTISTVLKGEEIVGLGNG